MYYNDNLPFCHFFEKVQIYLGFTLIHMSHHLKRLDNCLHYKPIVPEQYEASPKFIFNNNFNPVNEIVFRQSDILIKYSPMF